jgi:hypothetical protein
MGAAGAVRGVGAVPPIDAVEAPAAGASHPEGDGGDADGEPPGDGAQGLPVADGGYHLPAALGLAVCCVIVFLTKGSFLGLV